MKEQGQSQNESVEVLAMIKRWVQPEVIIKNLSFLVFLSLLVVIYITNSHYQLQLERKIDYKQRDLKTLRWEYMSIKSSVMYSSKQSEVERAVGDLGLKPLVDKPKLLIKKK